MPMKNLLKSCALAFSLTTASMPTTAYSQNQTTEAAILNEYASGIVDYINTNPVVRETYSRIERFGLTSPDRRVRAQADYFVRFVNTVQSGRFERLSTQAKRQHLHCALDSLEINLTGLSYAKQRFNNTGFSLQAIQREITSTENFHAYLQRNLPPRRQQCDYPRM